MTLSAGSHPRLHLNAHVALRPLCSLTEHLSLRGAGVFDGHGIQGRKAATLATEGILKYLQADPRADPESIPRQWERIFADACIQVGQSMLVTYPHSNEAFSL